MKDVFFNAADSVFSAFAGVQVTMSYEGLGRKVYDPSTGAVSSTPETHTFSGIILSYRPHEYQGLVQAGDKKIVIKADSITFTPEIGGHVTFSGERWRIVEPAPVYAGDAPVIYQLQVRK